MLDRLPDTRLKLYDQQVRAVNELNGEPIPGVPYKLTTETGEVYFGETDSDGLTLRVKTIASENIEVLWGALPPAQKP
ncbi:hypothetical protein HTY52_22995 [Cupriavidus taiwanensis]|nr:hypothetical protein [Cupriavidus taiwanensis]